MIQSDKSDAKENKTFRSITKPQVDGAAIDLSALGWALELEPLYSKVMRFLSPLFPQLLSHYWEVERTLNINHS